MRHCNNPRFSTARVGNVQQGLSYAGTKGSDSPAAVWCLGVTIASIASLDLSNNSLNSP